VFNLNKLDIIKKAVPNLIDQYSKEVKFFSSTEKVNYYPQGEDSFYSRPLGTELRIKEFILDDNKQQIEEELKKLISPFPSSNKTDTVVKENKLDKILQELMKLFPSKAFVIKSDHTRTILDTTYDKVKQELDNLGDNILIKPGNLLFNLFSVVNNIEYNVKKWENSVSEKFYGSIDIDFTGKKLFKKLIENAAYGGNNTLSLGTFIGYDGKVYNASQDTDVVVHEIGHSILDRLRMKYMDNTFNLDNGAIHEAFADINAFLSAALDDNVKVDVNKLDEPNALSSISELFGPAIYTKKEIEKKLLDNPYAKINDIKVNKPIRELSKLVNYKPYKELSTDEKEPHKYSLSLSTTFYKAFSLYAKELGDVKKASEEFFKIFSYASKLSPVANATLVEFYKSFIIADILYNDSKLSEYLVKAGKESNIFNQSIEDIKKEIESSRNIAIDKEDMDKILDASKNDQANKHILKDIFLKILRSYSSDFSYLDNIDVIVYPGIKDNINVEVTYKYPINLKLDNEDIPIYGGSLFVFDKQGKIVYTNIEKPSLSTVAKMEDYSKIFLSSYKKKIDDLG